MALFDENGWAVSLNGVLLDGCGNWSAPVGCMSVPTVKGVLTTIPDGLGLPGIRAEDVTYLERDGMRPHFDWYENRILTFTAAVVPGDCEDCGSVRKTVQDIVAAWSRSCDNVELVLWPPGCDCTGPEADDTDRPLGVIGRPRQAQLLYTAAGTANLILRFDSVDHRLYLLDCCGLPGSGGECADLTPNVAELAVCYTATCPGTTELGKRYDVACGDGTMGYRYTVQAGGDTSAGAVSFDVAGTECVYPTVTLYGLLTFPTIENLDTGQSVTYEGTVAVGSPVTIDLSNGTASEGGASRTHLLTGDLGMTVQPGLNRWRLRSAGQNDTGHATVCFRPALAAA